MTTNFYLVVARKGAQRITQTTPKLAPGEIAMHVSLDVPNSLFQIPILQAAITVPDTMPGPQPITAEMQDNIVGAVQQATGLQVRLLVENSTPETTL